MKRRLVIIVLLLSSIASARERHFAPSTVPWFPYVSLYYYVPQTFYAKNGGNNALAGTSPSTAWASFHGAVTCTGVCASTTPAPGDTVCLEGGSTWTQADLGVAWTASGTAGNPVTVGKCAGFGTGAPILDSGNTVCANNCLFGQFQINAHDVRVTGIAFRGMHQTSTMVAVSGVSSMGVNVEVDHNTFSRATHYPVLSTSIIADFPASSVGDVRRATDYDNSGDCTGSGGGVFTALCRWDGTKWIYQDSSTSAFISANLGVGASNLVGDYFHDNTIDNSDGDFDHFYGILHGDIICNNTVIRTSQGIQGVFNVDCNNRVYYTQGDFTGDHCNQVYHFGPLTGTKSWHYNNRVAHMQCSGGVTFWLNGLLACPGCDTFAYNNVLEDNAIASAAGFSVGYHPDTTGASTPDFGTFYLQRNTIESGSQAGWGNGEASPRSIVHSGNNLNITSASASCLSTGTTCIADGGDIKMSAATAAAQGYVLASDYAPVAGGSTINTGAVLTCSGCNPIGFDTTPYAKDINGFPYVDDVGAREFVGTSVSGGGFTFRGGFTRK